MRSKSIKHGKEIEKREKKPWSSALRTSLARLDQPITSPSAHSTRALFLHNKYSEIEEMLRCL